MKRDHGKSSVCRLLSSCLSAPNPPFSTLHGEAGTKTLKAAFLLYQLPLSRFHLPNVQRIPDGWRREQQWLFPSCLLSVPRRVTSFQHLLLVLVSCCWFQFPTVSHPGPLRDINHSSQRVGSSFPGPSTSLLGLPQPLPSVSSALTMVEASYTHSYNFFFLFFFLITALFPFCLVVLQ